MSQITTHILDTTKGRPATGVSVILYKGDNDQWTEIAKGITNEEGRIAELLKSGVVLPKGMYKIRFQTKDYFDKKGMETFYPYVEIIFDITTPEHYHIPLLLNPFGYSTYRGS